ncbi:MAG: 30S ribosomal protein S1 [Rickettsiales bacterium]|nr:30S ribosomal protein S1 [Rickettsiales bacterium]
MGKPRAAYQFESDYQTSENFSQLFDVNSIEKLEEGSTVKGIVVAKDDEAVLVDIGFKTEGRVLVRDFPDSERDNVEIGDSVTVFVERLENYYQEIVLSRSKAVQEETWSRLEKAMAKAENVDGVMTSRVKGGFVVDLGGCLAFLPGSQVDVRPIKDVTPLMNIVQPFQVLKMDRVRGNIIVSRRAIMEESLTEERSKVLDNIKEGDVVEGIVKNITDYGAFIDLGVVDGLLHVTDISWSRINHPSEVLKVGEKISLKVIKFDQNNKRISLGLKQLKSNPWDNSDGKFAEGTRHKGTITNITDYGVFVELGSGIEGLVHISEMSWSKKNVTPSQIYKKGDVVDVMILAIEPDKQRLSLGIKQCIDNPWSQFAQTHKKGDIVEGTIKSITDFGIFVGFEDTNEADGLIHANDLSWTETPEEAIKKYAKGQKIQATIIDLDPSKEKIGLSVKHLTGDPLASAFDQYEKGGVYTFTVISSNEDGVTVSVTEGVTTQIKRNDLSKDKVECRPERFSAGDRVDAKVTSLDKAKKEIKLSIKAYEVDEEKKAIEKYGSADSGAALGGILGKALKSAAEVAEEGDTKTKKKK